MPANVEIKARARDFCAQSAMAADLADAPAIVIDQRDVFYRTEQGRLKLRHLQGGAGELIDYDRSDTPGPRRSTYTIVSTDDAEALGAVLARHFSIRGEVRKRRRVLMVGQTRIHLDEVEGLGEFLELEVVLSDGQAVAEGASIAAELMARLGIAERDLIDRAYIDLLESK